MVTGKGKIVGLAPMAGYTDSPFRRQCKQYGADLVYTELISAQGIVYDKGKADKGETHLPSLELAQFMEDERPVHVQLFGNDPDTMMRAAEIVMEQYSPDGIDINMGCPARKVVKSASGSSLMQEPKLAADIVKGVKGIIGNKVLSVKTRLGWQDKREILSFAKRIEDAGCQMIAVHCRTKQQEHSGEPDWHVLRELKQRLSIPILANGGIKDVALARKCLIESGADGILIGRAALGRPWIFQEIMECKTLDLTYEEITKTALAHARLFNTYQNRKFEEMRKHLLFYFRGFPYAVELRSRIAKCTNIEELEQILHEPLTYNPSN